MNKLVRVIQLRNVPDELFKAAKVLAAQRGITLKALCLEALRQITEKQNAGHAWEQALNNTADTRKHLKESEQIGDLLSIRLD